MEGNNRGGVRARRGGGNNTRDQDLEHTEGEVRHAEEKEQAPQARLPAQVAEAVGHVADLVIGQTANILLYLAPRLGLVPDEEVSRLHAHQLQLTIADWVNEVHDTHHPIASSLYYGLRRER